MILLKYQLLATPQNELYDTNKTESHTQTREIYLKKYNMDKLCDTRIVFI